MSTHKSFSNETSERYSRALFEVSSELNDLEKVENDVKNFQSILNSSPDIKNFFKDPSKTITQQNEVIGLLSKKLEFSNNLKKFFLLIIEKEESSLLKKSLKVF